MDRNERNSAIEIVRADVQCHDNITLDVEHHAEIRLDFRSVNDATIASGKLLDFVRAQARIKRVLFENDKYLACSSLNTTEREPCG
jgi:hypothetical protein